MHPCKSVGNACRQHPAHEEHHQEQVESLCCSHVGLIAAFWSFDALRSQTALLFAPHAASRAIPLRHPPRSCFNWFAFAKHAPPHTRPTPSRLLSRIRRFWKNHENWMQVALCAVCCESVRRVTDHVPGRRGARQIRTTSRAAPPLSPRRALDLLPPAFLQRRW
jgi:hypothetical protein